MPPPHANRQHDLTQSTMPINVFVSYDHDDQNQVNGFKAIKYNPNHPLDFHDHSLAEPVTDRAGKPLRYPPSDPRSKPVRDAIMAKFERSSKLVVLIGSTTWSSEWVDWEIRTFYALKLALSGHNTARRIRGMTLKGSDHATPPPALARHAASTLSWDPDALDKWLDENPNG